MKFVAVSVAIVALLSCFLQTEACSCVPANMRQRNVGCSDEFMSIVTITGVKNENLVNNYSFKLLEDNTPSLAKKASLSASSTITTNDNSAACGVYLEVGATYLIKGSLAANANGVSTPHIFSCGTYARKLSAIPTQSEAKALFDALYVQEC